MVRNRINLSNVFAGLYFFIGCTFSALGLLLLINPPIALQVSNQIVPHSYGHGDIQGRKSLSLLIVPAVIEYQGRKVSLECIVDTGATISSIPHSAAKELGFDFRDPEHVQSVTINGVEQRQVFKNVSISIGDTGVYRVRSLILTIRDEEQGKDFCLIGQNYLQFFVVTIDGMRLQLHP